MLVAVLVAVDTAVLNEVLNEVPEEVTEVVPVCVEEPVPDGVRVVDTVTVPVFVAVPETVCVGVL